MRLDDRLAALPEPGPAPTTAQQAGVAAILRENPRPELLFIRRPERPGDPWSGNMALPGGRREPRDPDIAATAAREALEEVGLTLGRPLARLPTVWAVSPWRVGRLAIVPTVFADPGMPLRPDPREVAATTWIPLDVLAHRPGWRIQHAGPLPVHVRGVPTPTGLVWGLTLRIVRSLVPAFAAGAGDATLLPRPRSAP